MKAAGKMKERGRGKPGNLFVCFRPPCSHPVADRDESLKNYREKKRRLVKDGKVMSIDARKVSSDGGNEEHIPANPWSGEEQVVACISLHPDGHNLVIQTPAEIPLITTSKHKTVHAAFAKVFNAISFRNSINPKKDMNAREVISSTYQSRRSLIQSVSNRSKSEKELALISPASSTISSAISTDHSSAASSLRSSSTGSIAWSDTSGEDQHHPENKTCLTGISKSSKQRQYYYLHDHLCVSLPSLALCLLLLSTLSMMILLGKASAIIWTTSWLYIAAPQFRSAPHHELERGVGAEQRRLERSRSLDQAGYGRE